MSMVDLVCAKAPMAGLVRGLLERCVSADRLNTLFDRHSQAQYTRELLFSQVCDILLSTILRVHPSAHAAYQAHAEGLEASVSALYDKLKNVEPQVSRALVKEITKELIEIQDALGMEVVPWLPGYEIRILDGNCLAASERRLKVHRQHNAAALPGKSLVVMDPVRQLMIDVFPCEDGHAQERSLFDQVIPSVRANEVWIGDRNFCTCGFIDALVTQGAHVVLRRHGNLPFAEKTPWQEVAPTAEGQCLCEQAIEVNGKVYRHIRVFLATPTRDGDAHIDIMTSLPNEISAAQIAQLYRQRWTIEGAFQKLEAHLNSEIDSLAYPRAALFGFCLALVAFNIFSVCLCTLDCVHEQSVSQELSTYYIGHEIASAFAATFLFTQLADWDFLAKSSLKEFAAWLKDVAQHINIKKYKKHKRGPKKIIPKPPYDPHTPHVSTYQLLVAQKTNKNL